MHARMIDNNNKKEISGWYSTVLPGVLPGKSTFVLCVTSFRSIDVGRGTREDPGPRLNSSKAVMSKMNQAGGGLMITMPNDSLINH